MGGQAASSGCRPGAAGCGGRDERPGGILNNRAIHGALQHACPHLLRQLRGVPENSVADLARGRLTRGNWEWQWLSDKGVRAPCCSRGWWPQERTPRAGEFRERRALGGSGWVGPPGLSSGKAPQGPEPVRTLPRSCRGERACDTGPGPEAALCRGCSRLPAREAVCLGSALETPPSRPAAARRAGVGGPVRGCGGFAAWPFGRRWGPGRGGQRP